MRYTTAIAITLGLYNTWHRQYGICIPYCEVATLLVQFSVSAVLGWRTIAIWQKDARIIVIISLLLTTLMVFSSLLVLSMKAQRLPDGACILVEGGNYEFFPLAWFYAGTVLYDTIAIVLSTYRLWQHHNDVGVFPGANIDDTSKGDIGWAQWINSQWNSMTPLLFRLTSNGVLYLAFSTVFNVVCFIVGHWDEGKAQDLMLLYSSAMWVVCQHLVLLEIRATWGDRWENAGLSAAAIDETDRLIARILQASWSVKPPPAESKTKNLAEENKEPELVLSLSVDSCIMSAPKQGCGVGCAAPAQSKNSQTLPVNDARRPSLKSLDDEHLKQTSVRQLHDFRLSEPDEFDDPLGSKSFVPSDRAETMDVNTSKSALVPHSNDYRVSTDDKRSGVRQRLGALCAKDSPNKILFSLTKPLRGEATAGTTASPLTNQIEHPLMTSATAAVHTPPPHRDSTPFGLSRLSQAFERVPRLSTHMVAAPATSTCANCGNCDERRTDSMDNFAPEQAERRQMYKSASARDVLTSLEVAELLANMSDDAKTQALILAGMQRAETTTYSSPSTSCLTRTMPTKRPPWIIHPPL
nr:hypothetical protein BN887_04855 [Melanopsichium pennsylvanicum 4]